MGKVMSVLRAMNAYEQRSDDDDEVDNAAEAQAEVQDCVWCERRTSNPNRVCDSCRRYDDEWWH